jgi:hypothetical protein
LSLLALRAAEQLAVEAPRRGKVVDREGKVEGGSVIAPAIVIAGRPTQ